MPLPLLAALVGGWLVLTPVLAVAIGRALRGGAAEPVRWAELAPRRERVVVSITNSTVTSPARGPRLSDDELGLVGAGR